MEGLDTAKAQGSVLRQVTGSATGIERLRSQAKLGDRQTSPIDQASAAFARSQKRTAELLDDLEVGIAGVLKERPAPPSERESDKDQIGTSPMTRMLEGYTVGQDQLNERLAGLLARLELPLQA